MLERKSSTYMDNFNAGTHFIKYKFYQVYINKLTKLKCNVCRVSINIL